MKQILKSIVIFSVYQRKETIAINAENHQKTLDFLKRNGVPHIEAIGVYQNSPEQSIIAEPRDVQDLVLIKELSKKYNQESILISNEYRESSLVFLKDGSTKDIGTLKQVENVSNLDGYTIVNGLFYSCIK